MFGNISLFWKVMHFLPILPVYGIIFTVVYTFTIYCMKDLVKDYIKWKMCVCFLFYFCAIMTFVCHTISMFTDPGDIPIEYHLKMKELNKGLELDEEGFLKVEFKDGSNNKKNVSDTLDNGSNRNKKNTKKSQNKSKQDDTTQLTETTSEQVEDNEQVSNTETETANNINQQNDSEPLPTITDKIINETRKKNPFYCAKCSKWRPERSHHCKSCMRCVLTYDHHCPWIANCVGYKNHKNFLQFLLYATLGDFVAFLCLGYKLYFVDLNIVNYIKAAYPKGVPQGGLSLWDVFYIVKEPLVHLTGTMFAFAMSAAIGGLMVYQLSNITKGLTSCEITLNFEKKPKTRLQNFKDFMGHGLYTWLEPFSDMPEQTFRYFRPYLIRNKDKNSKKLLAYSMDIITFKELDSKKDN